MGALLWCRVPLVDFVCWNSGGLSSLRAVKRRRRRSSWKFHVAIGVTSISPERVDLPRCCNLLLNEFQKFRRVSMSDDYGVSCDGAQFQQELFTLRAQVAAESGLADAVRAVNNLATAQVRKDTRSLIDVKGLGRPKEFTGLGRRRRGILRWC